MGAKSNASFLSALHTLSLGRTLRTMFRGTGMGDDRFKRHGGMLVEDVECKNPSSTDVHYEALCFTHVACGVCHVHGFAQPGIKLEPQSARFGLR